MKNYLTKNIFNNDIAPNLDMDKLNHVVVPMGSGKTTLLKEECDSETLVLYPYRVSKEDYQDTKATHMYMNTFMNRMFPSEQEFDSELELFMTVYHNVQEYVYSNNLTVCYLDEADFFFVQSEASDNFVYRINGKRVLVDASVVTYIILVSLVHSTITVGFSANMYSYPNSVRELDFFNEELTHVVLVNMKPNTEVSNIVNVDMGSFPTATQRNSSLNDLILDSVSNNIPTLVFSSRFTVELMDTVKDVGGLIIGRQENTPTIISENGTKGDYAFTEAMQDTFIQVGKENSRLNDSMFDKHPVVMVGLSSSRSVSLVKDYHVARIIIVANKITSGVLQVIGRFRNTLVEVIIFNGDSSTINNAGLIDPYFDQYVWNVVDAKASDLNDLFGLSSKYHQRLDKVKSYTSYQTQLKRDQFDRYLELCKQYNSKPSYVRYLSLYPNGFSKMQFHRLIKEVN